MSNRHPFSGVCSFCGEGPEHHSHLHENEIQDANHALLVGQLLGMFMKMGPELMAWVQLHEPPRDSQGNYLDTVTIELNSGKYDVTVRPQQ